MAGALLKTATKLGVGGGAVYMTVQQGVWSGSTEGIRALDKVRSSVLPTANDYLKELPSRDEAVTLVVSKWNSGVQTLFRAVVATPDFTKDLVNRFNPFSDESGTQPATATGKD